jgi:hypothetical protein
MIDVTTPHGLGNRVSAMANGLSYGTNVRLGWRVNVHCPVAWRYVFPAGVPGVRIEDEIEPVFPRRLAGRMACDWDAAADRAAADAAYGLILASMDGEAREDAPRVALCGRFHRNPGADPADLAQRAIAAAQEHGEQRVFVFSDLHRDVISSALEAAGIQAVQPLCAPLAQDLQRTAVDVVDYLSDWKTLLAAKAIVALDGPASALHPARAAGIPIHYH